MQEQPPERNGVPGTAGEQQLVGEVSPHPDTFSEPSPPPTKISKILIIHSTNPQAGFGERARTAPAGDKYAGCYRCFPIREHLHLHHESCRGTPTG